MNIDRLKYISDDDEREKSRIFRDELLKFNSLHGRENFKVPQIGGKELDLFKLYKEVIRKGGSISVSEKKQWKEIVNALDLPASCTSASFTLRNHYNRCLQAYEAYFNKNQNPSSMIIPTISNNNNNNMNIPVNSHQSNNQQSNNLQINNQHNNQHNNQQNNQISNQPIPKKEEALLGKKIIRQDGEYNLIFRYQSKPPQTNRDKSYQKKIRLMNAVPDMRKIVLAFESHVTTEIIWALNILLLFSSNNTSNLQIEFQPYLIESMTNYLYYCINNISDMFFLIDIVDGNINKLKQQENNINNNNNLTGFNNINTINTNLQSQVFSNPVYINNNNNNNLSSLKNDVSILQNNYNNNNLNTNNSYNNNNNSMSTLNNLNPYPSNSYINQKDASTRLQNKRAKSFNENITFQFLEEINNTISLATISKKNKNLLEHEKKKLESQINLNLEEVSEFELTEHIITIIQIIRNLSFLKYNELPIFKCTKFMNILYLIFIWTNIQEMKTSCLEIINNLAKHINLKDIKYPMEILFNLFEYLKNANRENSELALECLRRFTFVSGNDEFYEKMPDEFFEEMINLLISYKVEVRESAIEILYFISDQKLPTKTRLGKQSKCIQRLVALICSNSIDSKISKLAVCTLAKLAEVPSIMKIINCYEQDLFFAACTDESISRVIMGILSNS
jgi:hypothetical protein